MKSLIFLISCLLITGGCNNSDTNYSSKTRIAISFKDEIYKYVYVDTSGYYKARDFEGIGNFKIGRTTINIITDLEKELYNMAKAEAEKSWGLMEQPYKNEMINTSLIDFKKNRRIYSASGENTFSPYDKTIILQLLPNPTDSLNNPSKFSYCPDVKVFKILNYTISNIELKDLYLTFNKDTLVELKCDENEKITEALEYKYGKGAEINESFIYRCGFNRVLRSGDVKIILWQNENILAELYKSHRYCGDDQFDYYFKINTKSKVWDLIKNCDTINKRIFINKTKKEELEKMKNF